MLTSEETQTNTQEDVRGLYFKLIDKISSEHPYVNEMKKQEYTPMLTNSLCFLFNKSQLTIDELKTELSLFINNMDIRTIDYLGNEDLKHEISQFAKCAVDIEVAFASNEKARFIYTGNFSFLGSVLMGRGMDELIRLENLAKQFFGYVNSKWELQYMFSSEDEIENIQNGRAASYKTFMTYEFLRFEEKWSDFLQLKDREIKESFKKSLSEILDEVKKGEYEWLQLN